jgi:hypothetical protein
MWKKIKWLPGLLMLTLLLGYLPNVWSAPTPPNELDDTLIDESAVSRPGLDDLLNPGGGETPPEEEPPEGTPSPGSGTGLTLDANDYLALRFSQDLQLNINGHVKNPIHWDTHLTFSLESLSADASSSILTYFVGIKHPALGQYQIFFSDFDTNQYRLTLKVQSPYGSESMELPPASQVAFQANDLNVIQYGGTDLPTPGTEPASQSTILAGEVLYVVEMQGDLRVAARAHPMAVGEPEVIVPETPEQVPGGVVEVPVPIPDTDTDTDIPTGPVGAVGAEFGGSGCMSQLQTLPMGGDFWIWLGALGVFMISLLRRS